MSADIPLHVARQPILDAQRTIFAYELFDRSRTDGVYSAASDAALLFNLLSSADLDVWNSKRPVFVNCTHHTLSGGHLDLVEPERVVLEIPPVTAQAVHATEAYTVEAYAAEAIEAHLPTLFDVHQRGFRLCFEDSVLTPAYAGWLPLASFIKLDLGRLDTQALACAVRQAKQTSNARRIATKVETAEQFQLARELGCHLFQGYWFARPVLLRGRTVRPAQATIIQLLNLVGRQASTNDIEAVLKHDPTLSFNLLRFINSAGFGLSCEITSFRHAVMILGLKKLFRWAALLLTTSGNGDVAPAVATAAVVRGRLMELLAKDLLSPEDCDSAFVTGVFSLLDTMLGLPLADALAAIALPATVTDALLHDRGVLAPFLRLALACENVDDEAFAATATALHLTGDYINLAHLDALVWADQLTMV
ncbi:EAL and HDOD domain-containing protein [Candidatus Symbiobacter mobilis]|uniref:Signal transduction type protein n=1 Tax=Candidatus Symbiobacter mobilis CR TaxID=946483 RepID=U5N8W0_9BURK|nr:HDOD domain-containing protein [Candidatus Symbiobacter mobilis]AGX86698.1 signal transduction type protein [Candidatus Symbiobacter mobilis CR]